MAFSAAAAFAAVVFVDAAFAAGDFAVDAFGAAGSDFLTVFFDADFLAAIV